MCFYPSRLACTRGRNSRAAQNRQRMVEEDGDEAYFNGDDDDEEQGVAVPTVGPHQANGGVAGGGE